MTILLDPRLWLGAVLWTVLVAGLGYAKGAKDERADIAVDQVKAVEQARDVEQELQRFNNRATAAYVGRLLKQQEKARALPTITLVHDCAVPASAGQLLNDAQRLPDDAGDRSGLGAATEAVDSTCAAELDIAKRNYAEVCIPNAEQLREVQKRWEETRQRLNQGMRRSGLAMPVDQS